MENIINLDDSVHILSIRVRIYTGATHSIQATHMIGLESWVLELCERNYWKIPVKISVETLSADDVLGYKKNTKITTTDDLADWLLDSDLHLIVCHVHQGAIRNLRWNMKKLQSSIWRLKGHRGFPQALKLMCPIFLQDKYR